MLNKNKFLSKNKLTKQKNVFAKFVETSFNLFKF